jgi:hypothetical protein
MKERVGDVDVEEVIGNIGVSGLNWAGTRMVQFCTEAGPIAGNSWLKKKRGNKYPWLRDNGSEKELMEWVLVDFFYHTTVS